MTWLAHWCFVRGVNWLFPHAFYYSVRGPRRDERPPDVGPHAAWWDRYGEYADACRRLSWLNTDCRHVCHIAILGQVQRPALAAGQGLLRAPARLQLPGRAPSVGGCAGRRRGHPPGRHELPRTDRRGARRRAGASGPGTTGAGRPARALRRGDDGCRADSAPGCLCATRHPCVSACAGFARPSHRQGRRPCARRTCGRREAGAPRLHAFQRTREAVTVRVELPVTGAALVFDPWTGAATPLPTAGGLALPGHAFCTIVVPSHSGQGDRLTAE